MARTTIARLIVNPPLRGVGGPGAATRSPGRQPGVRRSTESGGGGATSAHLVSYCGTVFVMNRRHERTLASIFGHPTSSNILWRDVEALLVALGAEVTERRGSRVGVRLFGDRRVFHRPHPGPDTDKGAVASIREWLRRNGVEP